MAFFLQPIQCCVSQWINKLEAQHLFQNVAYYVFYQMCKIIAIIKTVTLSKYKKRVHFSKYKTWVYFNIK